VGIHERSGRNFERHHQRVQGLVPYRETGAENDWRWGEQWLPHASWYLLAVASGGEAK